MGGVGEGKSNLLSRRNRARPHHRPRPVVGIAAHLSRFRRGAQLAARARYAANYRVRSAASTSRGILRRAVDCRLWLRHLRAPSLGGCPISLAANYCVRSAASTSRGIPCRAVDSRLLQRRLRSPSLGGCPLSLADRGRQYASGAHQAVLAKHGLIGSMSRQGNCWDNAVMEHSFLNSKMARVWYARHAEATMDLADDIVDFYNNVRLHSKLGNLPPNAFEHQSAIKQPIGVCGII